jgi:hypothetical protein
VWQGVGSIAETRKETSAMVQAEGDGQVMYRKSDGEEEKRAGSNQGWLLGMKKPNLCSSRDFQVYGLSNQVNSVVLCTDISTRWSY